MRFKSLVTSLQHVQHRTGRRGFVIVHCPTNLILITTRAWAFIQLSLSLAEIHQRAFTWGLPASTLTRSNEAQTIPLRPISQPSKSHKIPPSYPLGPNNDRFGRAYSRADFRDSLAEDYDSDERAVRLDENHTQRRYEHGGVSPRPPRIIDIAPGREARGDRYGPHDDHDGSLRPPRARSPPSPPPYLGRDNPDGTRMHERLRTLRDEDYFGSDHGRHRLSRASRPNNQRRRSVSESPRPSSSASNRRSRHADADSSSGYPSEGSDTSASYVRERPRDLPFNGSSSGYPSEVSDSSPSYVRERPRHLPRNDSFSDISYGESPGYFGNARPCRGYSGWASPDGFCDSEYYSDEGGYF